MKCVIGKIADPSATREIACRANAVHLSFFKEAVHHSTLEPPHPLPLSPKGERVVPSRSAGGPGEGVTPETSLVMAAQGRLVSPHFSPRVWKGGASAPPLQGLPDYSSVPCPAQSRACGTARGTGPTEGGSRDFGGAEAPPFRQSPESVQTW